MPDADDRWCQIGVAVGVHGGHPRVGRQVEIVGEVLPFDPVVLSDKEPVRIGIDAAGIDAAGIDAAGIDAAGIDTTGFDAGDGESGSKVDRRPAAAGNLPADADRTARCSPALAPAFDPMVVGKGSDFRRVGAGDAVHLSCPAN